MTFDEKIITIFCICDDCCKAFGVYDDLQCKMSSSEVMTTALAGAFFCYGNISRSCEILRSHNYIPYMLSISRIYRRWHKIPQEVWQVVLFLLAKALRTVQPSEEYIIDSFPLPVCQPYKSRICKLYTGKEYLGYCSSKKLKYYGLKGHLLVNSRGVIVQLSLSPASCNDVKAFTLMDIDLPKGSVVYGDKAYSSYLVEDLLLELDEISFFPQRRKNLRRQHNYETNRVIKSSRRMVETAIGAIQSMFPKAICARTSKGFELKIMMFAIAKSLRDFFRSFATA